MTADAVGGVWQYAVDLSSALAANGVEVLLATLGPAPSVDQLRSIESVPGTSLVHGNYALEWMKDPWADVAQAGDWLQSQQEKFRADLIHLNGFAHAALPWSVPVLSVAHSCVRSWWEAVHGVAAGAEWNEYTQRVKAGLDASSAVVAPTRSMGQFLTTEYGTATDKIHIIHNSTRVTEYNGKQKEAFILAAGRIWDEAKNFRLLEAIAPNVDWPIRVAGDQAAGTQTSGAVQLLGRLSHKRIEEQLRAASVFVHPALYEPFGLSVLEAARSRCCLVLSNIPSLRELWDGAAVFLDPRDPEMWSFELNELSRDFPRRRRLADLAAKRAGRYGPEAMLAGYRTLYSSLLTGNSRAEAAA